MEITVLAIDLAKEVFQLHGTDAQGRAVLKKRLRRSELRVFVANLKPCIIGLEACGGSHYWAREFQKFAHEVRLISPQFVKPFVKSQKNDSNDAEAIAEAVIRPSMRFVPVKQEWQQDIQNIHRIRQRLVRSRTALGNEIRGLLSEYGIVLPRKISNLRKLLPSILETQSLSSLAQRSFGRLLQEMRDIEEKIAAHEKEIEEIFKASEMARRIEKIPGVGVLTATALTGAVGDARAFKNGRQFAAWLGLVPRQNSSGGKTQLLGISKRGDVYLRTLLIHGARSALMRASRRTDRRSRWAVELAKNRGFNRATVALANKTARIIWVLMARGEEYRLAA